MHIRSQDGADLTVLINRGRANRLGAQRGLSGSDDGEPGLTADLPILCASETECLD